MSEKLLFSIKKPEAYYVKKYSPPQNLDIMPLKNHNKILYLEISDGFSVSQDMRFSLFREYNVSICCYMMNLLIYSITNINTN